MRFFRSGFILFFLVCFIIVSGCASSRPVATRSYAKGSILLVHSDVLNLRTCPSLSCKITAVLKRGEEMITLGEKNEWTKIRVRTSGQEGWVSSHFIVKKPQKKNSPEIMEEWSTEEKDKKASPTLKEEFSP